MTYQHHTIVRESLHRAHGQTSDFRLQTSTRSRGGRLAVILIASAFAGSCGDVVREGQSPAYLIIDAMTASSGARPGVFGTELDSDVVTLITATIGGQQVTSASVFEDGGQAQMRIAMKDIGTTIGATTPTTNNAITVTRYRVDYRRADGRNVPGVDVPYGFDGAVTFTLQSLSPGSFGFTLVRAQAKLEPPLRNMRGNGGSVFISTIADVTFYGRDQVGNAVSVAGSISVKFADWGDPIGATF